MSARLADRASPASSRPRLRLVPGTGRRALPFLVVSFALVGALLLAVVAVQTMASQASFRVQRISDRTSQLESQYGQLKLDVAELSSPARIVKEAKDLGFTLPTDVHTLPVGDPAPGGGDVGDHPSFSMKDLLGAAP